MFLTCATLKLKVPHLAANLDAGKLENDSKQKFLSDVFHRFRLFTFKTRRLKENVFWEQNVACVFYCKQIWHW